MKFEVKNRFTGDVQFTAEIHTESEDTTFRLGLAVTWAMESGANLCGADLRDADLRCADLCDACLRGADLRYSDLRSADLYGADLRYSDLRFADLCNACLRGAGLEHNKTVISCGLGDYAMLIHQGREGLMVKAGCRYSSIEAAKLHWSPKNQSEWTTKTDEYGERQLRMLAFLESEASLLGWVAEAGQVDAPIKALEQ